MEPCKFFGTTPCPPTTPSDNKFIPIPGDPLLNYAVATNAAAYRAMMVKVPADLYKAATNLGTWQALIKGAFAADKTGPGPTKFNSRAKGVQDVLKARAALVTAYLAKSK